MFNIKAFSGDKKIVYKPFSVSLKFLIAEKKLGKAFENLLEFKA